MARSRGKLGQVVPVTDDYIDRLKLLDADMKLEERAGLTSKSFRTKLSRQRIGKFTQYQNELVRVCERLDLSILWATDCSRLDPGLERERMLLQAFFESDFERGKIDCNTPDKFVSDVWTSLFNDWCIGHADVTAVRGAKEISKTSFAGTSEITAVKPVRKLSKHAGHIENRLEQYSAQRYRE